MSRPRLLGLGLVAAGLALAFGGVAADLVADWSRDESYSHSFLVLPLALWVAWRQRAVLASIAPRPSAVGLAVLAASLLALGVGRLGAEPFLTRIALLGALAGLIIFLLGVAHLKALTFAFVLLLFAIPIPAVIFDQVAYPLQLLAARFGEAVISVCQIPVLREGTLLHLASTSLEVAEACSGIWSLLSLLMVAVIWGYVTRSPLWMRWALAAASVPIAILGNGVRVAGSGIAAHLFGPGAVRGFPHAMLGWLVFIGAWALLLLVQRVAERMRPGPSATIDPPPASPVGPAPGSPVRPVHAWGGPARAVLAATCLAAAAAGVRLLSGADVTPRRESFASFPLRVGDWTARDSARAAGDRPDKAEATDALRREYTSPLRPGIGLEIRYYATPRLAQAVHSLTNGMPNAAWEPIRRGRATLSVAGTAGAPDRVFEVNRVVVRKGRDRMLVYYWYQAGGRVTAGELWARGRAVADAIRRHRSDGALVRLTVPLDPRSAGGDAYGSGDVDGDRAALEFARALWPVLERFLPS